MNAAPIYVATSNDGKVREIEALFAAHGLSAARFDGYRSPLEGESSYSDNAALKAHALRAQLRAAGRTEAVLADDSGLEVAALAGRPGVTTADYGGSTAGWPERRALLLAELAAAATPDRRARFVCALHYIDRDGRELGTFATVDGTIATEERGALGFSFDPIFVYEPLGLTFAELSDDDKNRVSHRAVAVAALAAAIAAAGRNLPVRR